MPHEPHVNPLGTPQPIPVFNCRILIGSRDASGNVVARAAELAEMSASGPTQREAMQKLVAMFKAAMARYHAAGEAVPWLTTPHAPTADEKELWTAVHL